MPGGSITPGDDIALPTLSTAQERDYVPHLASHLERDQFTPDRQCASEDERVGHESASDTATNSSDEFDWDEEEEGANAEQDTKAKRGRALYLAFMKLARPFRVILIGLLGTGILITPLLVIQLRFNGTHVRSQVHMWSLWLSIVWAASCITYLVVDSIPRLVVAIIVLFSGQVERLQTQLEVCFIIVISLSSDIDQCLCAMSFSWCLRCLGG